MALRESMFPGNTGIGKPDSTAIRFWEWFWENEDVWECRKQEGVDAFQATVEKSSSETPLFRLQVEIEPGCGRKKAGEY